MVVYNCCSAKGKDKDRSDVKEDVVVVLEDTFSDKDRRGGKTTTAIMGARGAIWTMLLTWRLYCTFPRKMMGGVLIIAALEGKTAIGLTMRRT
jgi:hypothetical protein